MRARAVRERGIRGIAGRFGAWAAAILCLGMAPAAAEEPHDSVRGSLAYIEATAKSLDVETLGQVVTATGTGFIVSSEGLVLTNEDLLDALGNVHPDTLEFMISLEEKSAQARPAKLADRMPNAGLFLLNMVPAPDPYPTLDLASAFALDERADLFASGFPERLSYQMLSGKIEAREGPGAYSWSLSDSIEAGTGMGGAPVYTGDGKVVGILFEGVPSRMIPIEFAERLIGQVRVQQLNEDMADIKAVLEDVLARPAGVDPGLAEDVATMKRALDALSLNITWRVNPWNAQLEVRRSVPGTARLEALTLRAALAGVEIDPNSAFTDTDWRPRFTRPTTLFVEQINHREEFFLGVVDLTPILNELRRDVLAIDARSIDAVRIEFVPVFLDSGGDGFEGRLYEGEIDLPSGFFDF